MLAVVTSQSSYMVRKKIKRLAVDQLNQTDTDFISQ